MVDERPAFIQWGTRLLSSLSPRPRKGLIKNIARDKCLEPARVYLHQKDNEGMVPYHGGPTKGAKLRDSKPSD